MSGLAQVLHEHGHQISGSDAQSSEVIQRLGRRDIPVSIGHDAGKLPAGIECMVVSAAVKADNPEWDWARKNNVRVMKYAEMLGELSGQMDTIAVAGTHGKSTTSGWLAYMLKEAGADPSYVIGADVEQLGGGSGAGQGEALVVEACEYDRSFLNLRPHVGMILNVEADHLDYYRDLDDIIGAFGEFSRKVMPNGVLVANGDDENVARALADYSGIVEYFGRSEKAHWRAENLDYEKGHGCFDLVSYGKVLGRVKSGLPGEHNVSNALAAAAAAWAGGLSAEPILEGIKKYVGVERRMSYKGCVAGVVVMDDYGHHPTEIQATLATIKAAYRPKRLWCVFQPHQHSRTRFFLDDFAVSFGQADVVLLPDIYFVRDSEKSRRQVSAEQLAQKINLNGRRAEYLGEFSSIIDYLADEVQEDDLVVTMGAGDVWEVADGLICRLRAHS